MDNKYRTKDSACSRVFIIQNGVQITFRKAMDIIHGEHKDRRKIIK